MMTTTSSSAYLLLKDCPQLAAWLLRHRTVPDPAFDSVFSPAWGMLHVPKRGEFLALVCKDIEDERKIPPHRACKKESDNMLKEVSGFYAD
jgi:hypothetical protein